MYRVVIVEDDPMVSFLNRTYTERDGRFQVVQSFQNGREALNWLSQHSADLLILDVYMPGLTGAQLLQQLRDRRIGVDALMVTAANDARTVDGLLKLGVVDYLVKPFTIERFQRALDTFCRHREAVAGGELSQDRLDQIFSPPPAAGGRDIPKGLQEDTLALVWDCLKGAPAQGLTSDALAQRTGLSTVTVRRYVNYLVSQGEAVSTVNYDTGGRPCRLYRCAGAP